MQPEDKNLESNILYKSKWLRPCPFCGKILLKFREIIKIVQLNRAETVGKKFRQRPPLQDTVAGTIPSANFLGTDQSLFWFGFVATGRGGQAKY